MTAFITMKEYEAICGKKLPKGKTDSEIKVNEVTKYSPFENAQITTGEPLATTGEPLATTTHYKPP